MANKYTTCPDCAWIQFRRFQGERDIGNDQCGRCRSGWVPLPETTEQWAKYYAACPPARCDQCHCEIKLTVETPIPMTAKATYDGTFFLCPDCLRG